MGIQPGGRVGLGFAVTVLIAFGTQPALGRDFAERPDAFLLTGAPRPGLHLIPRVYADTGLTYQLWETSPEDEFQLRSSFAMALAEYRGLVPFTYYATYMFAGPVGPDDTPGAEAAQWMMNAIQFEYGVGLQYRPASWTYTVEYSRRSYHPLRGGFGEPAADIVRLGLGPPAANLGPLRIESLVRFGWLDLYDFWGARIPDPRADFGLYNAVEVRGPRVVGGIEPFVVGLWDAYLLEDGAVQHDVAVEAGLGLMRGTNRFELYLDFYTSPDTEQREDRRSPATLLGYGFRMVAETGRGAGRSD